MSGTSYALILVRSFGYTLPTLSRSLVSAKKDGGHSVQASELGLISDRSEVTAYNVKSALK